MLRDILEVAGTGVVFLVVAVLVACVASRSTLNAGNQFVGENVHMLYMNKDKKRAAEHVIYQKEDERKEDQSGEDLSRLGPRTG